MKVVVACSHDQVCGLGHSDHLHVYTVENNAIVKEEKVDTPEQKHGVMPDFVASLDPYVILVEHVGEHGAMKLREKNIEVIQNVTGKPGDAVRAYLDGSLLADDSCGCGHGHDDHHHHHHDGGGCCGGHGHGHGGGHHGHGGGCGCSH